ncbi:hypothetical protein [Streptomyces sp. NPDC001970]
MPHMPAALALRSAVGAGRRYADRWAVSPRAVDAVTALSCFALMLLDVPGLAKADNSLGRVSATVVLAAGAATLLRRRAPWVPYLAALGCLGWLHVGNPPAAENPARERPVPSGTGTFSMRERVEHGRHAHRGAAGRLVPRAGPAPVGLVRARAGGPRPSCRWASVDWQRE